jgi:hypothetical protein
MMNVGNILRKMKKISQLVARCILNHCNVKHVMLPSCNTRIYYYQMSLSGRNHFYMLLNYIILSQYVVS